MSRLLESLLGAERRAQCEAADAAMVLDEEFFRRVDREMHERKVSGAARREDDERALALQVRLANAGQVS